MTPAEYADCLREALGRATDGHELDEMDIISLMKILLQVPGRFPCRGRAVETDPGIGRELLAQLLCDLWALPENAVHYKSLYDAADFRWDSEALTDRIYEWGPRLRQVGFHFQGF